MAYTPVSKTGGVTPVRVQLPPSALIIDIKSYLANLLLIVF